MPTREHSLLVSIATYDELDSTNNFIAKALETGQYTEGTVILAHFQTGGRGQRGRIWQSNAGENLTFSFALANDFLPAGSRFMLSKAVSLGIADYLNELGITDVRIKWPNDILAGHAKIAGILIENTGKSMPYSIVGIGLNMNQTQFGLHYAATSVALEKGLNYNPGLELRNVIIYLERRLHMLFRGEDVLLHADYMDQLYGRGGWVNVKEGPRSFSAMITDVDQSGLLSLRSKNGTLRQYQPRDVSITF